MSASTIRLLLRIAHRLRYRELTELIGRRVDVMSLASIEPALRGHLGYLGELGAMLNPTRPEGALAKYGLVDAELAAPHALLDGAPGGLAALRGNGLLTAPEPGDDDFAARATAGFLDDVVQDFDAPHAFVKLFLDDGRGDGKRLELFPCTLTVVDACVTNAGMIWFAKHFYW